jgi:anti-sigma factor RsiW
MHKIPRLTQEQRSNLVAYLDGELPDKEVRDIDQVLSKSPTVRHDVEMLARTWDLLDELPRLSSGDDFTARTLTVAQDEEAPRPLLPPAIQQRLTNLTGRLQSQAFRRGAITLAWVAVLAASAVAGFAVTSRWIPDSSEDLLRNFEVVEKLDLYKNVESVDYLRQLDEKIGSFDARPASKQ